MTLITSREYDGDEFTFEAEHYESGDYGPLSPEGGAMGITFSAHLPLDMDAALQLAHEILGHQYEIVAAVEDCEANPIWVRYAGKVDGEHQWNPLWEPRP